MPHFVDFDEMDHYNRVNKAEDESLGRENDVKRFTIILEWRMKNEKNTCSAAFGSDAVGPAGRLSPDGLDQRAEGTQVREKRGEIDMGLVLPEYHAPDFAALGLEGAPEARLAPAERDGVVPAG